MLRYVLTALKPTHQTNKQTNEQTTKGWDIQIVPVNIIRSVSPYLRAERNSCNGECAYVNGCPDLAEGFDILYDDSDTLTASDRN